MSTIYLRSGDSVVGPARPFLYPDDPAHDVLQTIGRVQKMPRVSKVRATLVRAFVREKFAVVNTLAERLYVQVYRDWGGAMYFGQTSACMAILPGWPGADYEIEPHTTLSVDKQTPIEGFNVYRIVQPGNGMPLHAEWYTTKVLEWTRGEGYDDQRDWTLFNDSVCDFVQGPADPLRPARICGQAVDYLFGPPRYHWISTAGGPGGPGVAHMEAWQDGSGFGLYAEVQIEVFP